MHNRVSTGVGGFDTVIDHLRYGDNVVWQVDSVSDYLLMASPYVKQAVTDGRKVVYIRFGKYKELFRDEDDVTIFRLDASRGFESFTSEVYQIIRDQGYRAFYVFDCLTDLLEAWYSDLMIGNFFKIACPFLYELDTVAYFAILRNAHTYNTIAGIRETTQLLVDLYRVKKDLYVHPLKVWQRYSPTMFFPHMIDGAQAYSITSSAQAAALFSSFDRTVKKPDYRDTVFAQARDALDADMDKQESAKRKLMSMIIGGTSRMFYLCNKYFSLRDVLSIASRVLGTGQIGGKSIGMLVARKILESDPERRFNTFLEPHDSFYLGTDIYYTYIVQNGWWELRTKQKTYDGYYTYAEELKQNLLRGKFPEAVREEFQRMLEYFGQSPIIVRSSSLLEDNFGNAFAGKYESVFCVNQGTPAERYAAFEQAVRVVYASTMNEDALAYRMNRGLFESDEQMAILIQRVSGNTFGEYFFPHLAGVGNSSNLYVWDKSVNMDDGMIRLVFGLGTRAVERTVGDYAKIVCLDAPLRNPPVNYEDIRKYSQHYVDVLSLAENAFKTVGVNEALSLDLKTEKTLFAVADYEQESRLRERGGFTGKKVPPILKFDKLLANTDFPKVMKDMLKTLSDTYDYPVDIEFTVNFFENTGYTINLLQCRPLQTRGLGKPVKLPQPEDEASCFFSLNGNFMGGNIRLQPKYVVYVDPKKYAELSEQDKYVAARTVGKLNTAMKQTGYMLVGPGRWGTTTPSLGVPVHFSELSNAAVICEVASRDAGFMPELSYGSHFFQDLVESGIFYAAIFDGDKEVIFNPEYLDSFEDASAQFFTESTAVTNIFTVKRSDTFEIFSDIVMQKVICL